MTQPVAFITGAAAGIGLATAKDLSRRGYAVALLDSDAAALATAAAEFQAAGAQALAYAGDVGDLQFAESALRKAAAHWGRLDLLINNAAWRELVSMRRITLESWERTLRVCLTAPAFLARTAAEIMEPQGRGVIVNVSSIRSFQPDGLSAAYVAAKRGAGRPHVRSGRALRALGDPRFRREPRRGGYGPQPGLHRLGRPLDHRRSAAVKRR